LADAIDGVDLSHHRVGDLMDLSQHDADVLIAEGWAKAADADRDHLPADTGSHRTHRQPNR
jgi:hypothetical protein